MSKIEMLRLLINQRLTAAAEEIFCVFGRTIVEYEEELARSKLEIARQRRLLELCKQPRVCLQGDGSPPPEPQDFHSEAEQSAEESLHIKVEEDDSWSDQQTCEQDSADVMFVDRVQPEDDDVTEPVPPASSQDELEPAAEPPARALLPTGSSLSVVSSLPENSDKDELLNGLQGEAVAFPPEMVGSHYICTICEQVFVHRADWVRHVQLHRKVDAKGEKSYTCDICGKKLTRFDGYQKHLRVHTGEKPYCCMVCGRRFSDNSNYKRHFRTHVVTKTERS